jgi:hypothetical protein
MTPDQQRSREKVRRYVHREQLASVMNDTKWQELVDAMRAIADGTPMHRIKDVLGPDPDNEPRDGEWYYHLWPYYSIEWIDINPICWKPFGPQVDQTGAIVSALRERNIPFSIEGRYIRVWGYTRPGATVHFANTTGNEQPQSAPSAD